MNTAKKLEIAERLLIKADERIEKLERQLVAYKAETRTARELLLSYTVPTCTVTGLCHIYGEVILHTQDCQYLAKSQAYLAARVPDTEQ